MMKSTSAAPDVPANTAWWAETSVLFVLCYLKAGWPPPDANEAHYLAKAKHYWDSAWCPGDFFLQSADAHTFFYWTFGWVCDFVSLPTAAWIGRIVTWLLIAWAWQRLSFALVPVRWGAVLSGGLMIVLTTVGHLAGEWLIGGVEAKGFAFVLVFLGLEQLVKGNWSRVWLLLGLASAFHVLVGGWAVAAALLAWCAADKERPSLVRMLPALAGGFALALCGLIPAVLLNWGADPATVREANQIYVYERLPHHLAFHSLPRVYMARHAALIAGFAWLAWLSWRLGTDNGARRFVGFVLGTVIIAVIGIVIDQSLLHNLDLAASLLRFYWYRASDIFVPGGVALLLVRVLWQLAPQQPRMAMAGVVAATLGFVVPLVIWNLDRQQHFLPGSIVQAWQQSKRESWDEAAADFADWCSTCDWIKQNTPTDAIFLTPRNQQTFKWYAERAEVVAVKDIPQDARGIVAWRDRLREVFTPPVSELGFGALTQEQILALANKYGASYVLIETHKLPTALGWQRVYPTGDVENGSYAVYRIPR